MSTGSLLSARDGKRLCQGVIEGRSAAWSRRHCLRPNRKTDSIEDSVEPPALLLHKTFSNRVRRPLRSSWQKVLPRRSLLAATMESLCYDVSNPRPKKLDGSARRQMEMVEFESRAGIWMSGQGARSLTATALSLHRRRHLRSIQEGFWQQRLG